MSISSAYFGVARGNAEQDYLYSRSLLILFGLTVTLMVASAWAMENYVLTADVYARVLSTHVNATRARELVGVRNRWGDWPFLLGPLIIGLRAAVLASLLQLVLLFYRADVPFSRLFGAIMPGELVLVAAQCLRTLWLMTLPGKSIGPKELAYSWGALSNFMGSFGQSHQLVLGITREFTPIELAWFIAVSWFVSKSSNISLRRSMAAVVTLWLLVSGVEWLLVLYLSGAGL